MGDIGKYLVVRCATLVDQRMRKQPVMEIYFYGTKECSFPPNPVIPY